MSKYSTAEYKYSKITAWGYKLIKRGKSQYVCSLNGKYICAGSVFRIHKFLFGY